MVCIGLADTAFAISPLKLPLLDDTVPMLAVLSSLNWFSEESSEMTPDPAVVAASAEREVS